MKKRLWLVRPMVVAVGSCFGAAPALANPTGAQVMQGAVQMQGLGTNNLRITNSPGSIIHWQGFSIGAGQVTQFVQQSASSAVLNRVVGANISQIQGQLLSNGRVFLINPAGILIGAGAVIDTAGFVGSTLRMLDGDFLSGKLKFQGDANAGSIVNQGWIKAGAGGNIVLVAPNIQNSGVIQTEGGQIVLAAGQKMTIGSLDLEGVQFEIQAPTDSVLNVGKLLADGGAVGVFAGTLKHTGDIRANALTRDAAGRIVLKGQSETTLAGNSTTSATGGKGGDITVLGDRVALTDNTKIDASGTNGGGQIRVGGDYQGRNAALQNASRSYVGPNVKLSADAIESGNGGRIIVWADDTTQYFGNLSARGGQRGGNGGFAEVSGKQQLIYTGGSDLSAPKGAFGTLLLDPLDLFIADVGSAVTEFIDAFADVAGNAVTITPAALAAQGGNVVLQAGRYMRFINNVDLSNQAGKTLTATVDTRPSADPTDTTPRGTPPNRMDIAASITTAGGAIALNAPSIQGFNAQTLSTVGGGAAGAPITLNSNAEISASQLSLNAGSGAISLNGALVTPSTNHFINMNMLTGASVNASTRGSITTNAITTTGAVSLNSAGGSITLSGDIASGGGDVSLIASGTNSSVSTRAINAVSGAVDISALSSIATGFASVTPFNRLPITTTSRVNLTTAGNSTNAQSSINVRVNGGAAVTASATSSTFNNATVTIGSDNDLNATNVSATATTCSSSSFCQGASVNLSATGSVNVGSVTANASRVAGVFANESVAITSGANAGAGINAMTAASQVKAVNVSLTTGAGTGGGIGSTVLPFVVNAERNVSLSTNGAFTVILNGPTINQFSFLAGVAPTGGSYSGTVTRPSGGLTLAASATDSTVTIDNPTFVGFKERVFNSNPFITIGSSSGALNVPTLVVPEGDTTVPPPPPTSIFTVPLTVTVQAAGNLTLGSYTRQNPGAGLPKNTVISSTGGSATLGTIDASKDSVSVTAPFGITITPAGVIRTEGAVTLNSGGFLPDFFTPAPGPIVATRIESGGAVSLTSNAGDITLGDITGTSVSANSTTGSIFVRNVDTSAANGSVTLSISCVANSFSSCGTSPAVVGAAAGKDDGLFEVRAGTGTISVTGQTIGTAGFTNPLDLQAAAITLTSTREGGRIGFSGAPVQANAPDLTIVAADRDSFSGTAGAGFIVSTGATALQNLTVTVNPANTAPLFSSVISGPATYSFRHGGTFLEFLFDEFNPSGGPSTQFTSGGLLSVTANRGDIRVTSNINMGVGKLMLDSRSGDIDAGGAMFDGAGLTFLAGSGAQKGARNLISTNAIGTVVSPADVVMTAGTGGVTGNVNGAVQNTGGIFASDVAITTHNGDIRTGSIGSGTPGTVNLTANPGASAAPGVIAVGDINGTAVTILSEQFDQPLPGGGTTPVTNTITTGNITGTSIDITNLVNTTTTGNLNATAGIGIVSRNSVTTGSLTAQDISIQRNTIFAFDAPVIQVNGAIAAKNATLVGRPLTITGAVAGAADADIRLYSESGTSTTIGGPITASGSSRIDLISQTGFDFSTINAGADGTVLINAVNGPIQQTAAGGGITAKDVTLNASTFITNTSGGGSAPDVDLFGVANLTASATGRATFDVHGSTLSLLHLTKGSVATAPFALNGLNPAQTILLSSGAANATLRVNSPSPLDFNLSYTGGNITLTGEGLVTGGGPAVVSVTGGDFIGTVFDGTNGGIRTAGGVVSLRGNTVTTGTVDTRGSGVGGGITVFANPNVIISGNLLTGAGGGAVFVTAANGSVTRAGSETIQSGTSVSVSAANGNVGNSVTNLLPVTATDVTLSASGTGRVFADLTGASTLDLRGDDGFRVVSDTPFNTLTVASKGSGTGPLDLIVTPGGQTFSFGRTTVDGVAAFQVLTADLGVGQPSTNSATFRPSGGEDLFIGGGATINVPNLVLNSFLEGGDIKLQGSVGTPLVLSNTNQTINSSRDVRVSGNVTLTASGNQSISALQDTIISGNTAFSAPTQSISAFRDVSITGNPTISAGTTQSISAFRDLLITATGTISSASTQALFASRDLTAQAQGGTLMLTAPTQSMSTNAGTLSFLGGPGNGDAITVAGTVRQNIFTPQGTTSLGGIRVQGGDGNNASATVSFNGPADSTLTRGSAEQQLEAGGQIRILGGTNAAGTGAFALVTSNQRQTIRALGNTVLAGEGSIQLTGGAGTGGTARIVGTGNVVQQVAEGRCFVTTFSCSAEPYQTPSLTVQGGSGADSFAEIVTVGHQQIVPNFTLSVIGGTGPRASARIDNLTTNRQSIGVVNTSISGDGGANTNNALFVRGGSGTDSFARILAAGPQAITATSSTTLTAGAGSGADALISSTGPTVQDIRPGNLSVLADVVSTDAAKAQIDAVGDQSFTSVFAIALRGGAGVGSSARITTPGTQTFGANFTTFSSLNMTGGSAANTFAMIDAGGSQTFNGTSFGGAIGLTAGGTLAAPAANAGAVVTGNNQFLSCTGCVVTMTGGAGIAGATSDAVFSNLSGNQSFTVSSLAITGGLTHSTAGLLNPATSGTQTVTTSGAGGIAMQSALGALGDGFARVQNLAPTLQSVTASTSSTSGGGISLNNRAAGTVGITSAGRQNLQGRFLDVMTAAGSTGDAVVSAGDHQFIRTTNGTTAPAASFRVAAVGSGTASVISPGVQLIEVDYLERVQGLTVPASVIIGNTAGAGTSLVQAADQRIFAGIMSLVGGTGGGTASIAATSGQAISAVAGGLSLGAGDLATSKATISAPMQTLVVSGDVVLEGRGAGAVAVTSGGTQILSARALDVRTLAGTAPNVGANASVCAGSTDACVTVTGAGDQTIYLGGNLADTTPPFISMRVAALGTGTAKVQAGGTQTLNVGHPGASAPLQTATTAQGVEGQLLIGRLDFGPAGTAIVDPTTGNPAAGNSHVIATNQTIHAGSIFIQGPTGANNTSRLSATGTQAITTHVGGISIIGGSNLNAFAEIDPTNQTITSFGPMYLQGGTGTNADAIINGTGPQSVTTLNGPLTLQGGIGPGADALISGGAPQTINAAGGVIILPGPAGGGIGALNPGQVAAAGNAATDAVAGEIVRERDNLENVIDDSASRENEDSRNRGGIQLCS